jgi:hypothetical protein
MADDDVPMILDDLEQNMILEGTEHLPMPDIIIEENERRQSIGSVLNVLPWQIIQI